MEGCRIYPAASAQRMELAPSNPSCPSPCRQQWDQGPHNPLYRMQEMNKQKARDSGNFCMGIKKNKLSLSTEQSQGTLSAARVLYLEYLEREQVK